MTLDDKAYAMFSNSPWVWFGVKELSEHLGIGGWRTRVSTARRRGLNIQNHIVVREDGRRLSFYQYRPIEDRPGQASLFTGDASLPRGERQGDLGRR